MSNRIKRGRLLGRTITVAGLLIGSTVVTTAAFATTSLPSRAWLGTIRR
jgi:hypothetical protein